MVTLPRSELVPRQLRAKAPLAQRGRAGTKPIERFRETQTVVHQCARSEGSVQGTSNRVLLEVWRRMWLTWVREIRNEDVLTDDEATFRANLCVLVHPRSHGLCSSSLGSMRLPDPTPDR